jgi:thiol:disulfide interchange protein
VNARIDAAFVAAGASGRRVIIDLGGNWCGWCRALDAVMDAPEVKPFIAANFVVVPVDVASADFKIDRNLAVLQRFGVGKVAGVPWLIVADADGKVLASSDAVTDDAHQTPQQMVDWLALYAKRPAA